MTSKGRNALKSKILEVIPDAHVEFDKRNNLHIGAPGRKPMIIKTAAWGKQPESGRYITEAVNNVLRRLGRLS